MADVGQEGWGKLQDDFAKREHRRTAKRFVLIGAAIAGASVLVVPLTTSVAGRQGGGVPTSTIVSTQSPQASGMALRPGFPFAAAAPGLPTASSSGAITPPGAMFTGLPATTTYRGNAGFGCLNSPLAAFAEAGEYTDGTSGWYVTSGGVQTRFCSGQAIALPMSGSPQSDDASVYAQWAFHVGGSSKQCSVVVHVPGGPALAAATGAAFYSVQSAPGAQPYASFTIDQSADRDRWVAAGTFPVNGADLVIVLHDRGQDWNASGGTGAHIGASQIAATCTN